MDQFHAMKTFTEIVATNGFTRAADALHLPHAVAKTTIQRIREKERCLSSDGQPRRATSRPKDPWTAVVSLLDANAQYGTSGTSGRTDTDQGSRSARRLTAFSPVDRGQRQPLRPGNALVTFVERLGPKSVSINWRDSMTASYSEQLWMRKVARKCGVCALSGMTITPGDAVYGPANRISVRPLNWSEMLLAAMLEGRERARSSQDS